MFPLIRTVLNRDFIDGTLIHLTECYYKGEHPKVQG